MKQYIRTKDGKIYEAEYIVADRKLNGYYILDEKTYIQKECIIAEADNIFDLIRDGDLIVYGINLNDKIVDKIASIDVVRNKEWLFDKQLLGADILRFYTKQGDNYILVWDKERGVI